LDRLFLITFWFKLTPFVKYRKLERFLYIGLYELVLQKYRTFVSGVNGTHTSCFLFTFLSKKAALLLKNKK